MSRTAPARRDDLRAPGAPLGPGSLLHAIATDWRSGISGLSAGILQLMYPHLGRGVEEHSAFFTEPWDRIHRSVPQIWDTILADDAEVEGRRIRDLHKGITGTDDDGRRYHALDPATFWWAHATFTWEMFETADRWDHRRLSKRRREQLYQETVTWYRRYGVSDRVVPHDLAAFDQRFDEICRYELAMTPTAARALEMALDASVAPPGMPAGVAKVMVPVLRLLTVGGLPKVVRRRFDIPWSAADEAGLVAVTTTIRNMGAVLPRQIMTPRYLRTIERMGEMAAPPTGGLTLVPKVATAIDVDAVLAGVVDGADIDDVDAAVLDVAAALLVSEGIAAVEVDVVAARSGVARSTIYRRFGSRNGVLAAALAHEARRFFAVLAEQVSHDGSGPRNDSDAGVADAVVDAFARGLRFARVAGLATVVRSEPLLLSLLTIDGAPLIAAARDQLVEEARRRVPDVDVAWLGHHAEVLVRLAISYVVTPPTGDVDEADVAVLATVRHLVTVATGQRDGERSVTGWDRRG